MLQKLDLAGTAQKTCLGPVAGNILAANIQSMERKRP